MKEKNSVGEERKNVLVVYYGKESKGKIKAFFYFIRKDGFECRMMGPINSPDCPWVFVYLDKKEFIVGKPGVEFASERYIEHAVLINEFKTIYEIYKNVHTLNDKQIYEMMKKYDSNSVLCFDMNCENTEDSN